jgi:acyl-CoA reductase-like NAD-dependent aldehyde dehydrogenase
VIVDVPRDCEMICEESFGPLAPIIKTHGIDDAIELANASAFGLSAGVVSRSIDVALKAAKEIRTGTVNINEIPGWRTEASPFGGVKDSGLGIKEGVVEAMKFLSNVKTISLPW